MGPVAILALSQNLWPFGGEKTQAIFLFYELLPLSHFLFLTHQKKKKIIVDKRKEWNMLTFLLPFSK